MITIGESSLKFSSVAPQPEADAAALAGSVDDDKQAEKAQTVNYDDAPLGHTQVQISVNEIIGRRSNLSLEMRLRRPKR